jgi:hypothetical protein
VFNQLQTENKATLPEITNVQRMKLQQLSIVTLSERARVRHLHQYFRFVILSRVSYV